MTELTHHNRTLYLLKDPNKIRDQVEGRNFTPPDPNDLLDNISTDAIIPSPYCYDDANPERLGRYALVGLSNLAIAKDDLIKGSFTRLVAGQSFGRGSSREHAQLALKGAGIKEIVTVSAERIFRENCINYGIQVYPFDNDKVRSALVANLNLPFQEYLDNLPPLSQEIAKSGGLLLFMKHQLPHLDPRLGNQPSKPRRMTLATFSKSLNFPPVQDPM